MSLYKQISSTEPSLTKDPDRFSDEAWDLLLDAEEATKRWRNENLDVEHLIYVLFTEVSYQDFVEALPINHENLLNDLENFLANLPTTSKDKLFIGEDLEELLDQADQFRAHWGSKLIEISHILMAIARDKRVGSALFKSGGLPSERLETELRRLPMPKSFNKQNDKTFKPTSYTSDNSKSTKPINNQSNSIDKNLVPYINTSEGESQTKDIQLEIETTSLDSYGKDLTSAAREGELDPVIGREQEIMSVIKVLSRRGKNNPVLIGAPGVGKTAIAELLAQKIINEEVPDSLKDSKLISLDIGALIAGTKFRGQFEERLRSVLNEIKDPSSRIILFIDELHNIINTNRSSADAGSLLKPLLASGELRCIGATTPENYRKTIEKDQALNRRFQKVSIKEPNLDLSIEILRGLKEKYEVHHGVSITDEAIRTANRLADRYISDRCLPDKAIDLIDEAAAQLKIQTNSAPQEIKTKEESIKKINKLINQAEINKSEELINKFRVEKSKILDQLSSLKEKWEEECKNKEDLQEIMKQEKEIINNIIEAENLGDLEEASRLEYGDLHLLKRKKTYIEDRINQSQIYTSSLQKNEVNPDDIADVVARWTGIPISKVLAGEKQKLLDLEKELGMKVIGQYQAIKAVAASIRRARAGMKDIKRPVGSFMFLGPTGVGKTELAKTLAFSLFDEEDALVRLDMSEFMERNAVARLLGAPPGYIGYEEGGQLTEAVRRRPYAVLLLDEIEKAHPDVFNILLQVLDDGRLTDSQGRTIDFRHTIIVMTSNIASRAILKNAKQLKEETANSKDLNHNLSKEIENELTNQFRPEFLNRIDEVIKFSPLTPESLQKIVRLHIAEIGDLLEEQNLKISVDNETIEMLASEGYEPEYGARPLRRVLRRRLENPLATQLLEDNFVGAKTIRIIPPNDPNEELIFIREN